MARIIAMLFCGISGIIDKLPNIVQQGRGDQHIGPMIFSGEVGALQNMLQLRDILSIGKMTKKTDYMEYFIDHAAVPLM